jgi:TPR repeat protein
MTTKRCSIPIKMILALMLVLPACSQEELLLTSSLGTAAEQGDAEAQSFLGVLYKEGWGVPQNYDEALHWFQAAAEQGNAEAQSFLGVLYKEGWGVPQNYDEALHWFQAAAEQGNAEAQSFLGAMYFLGQGVPQDYIQASTWTSLAASTANELGIENIELITKVMTPEEIAAAQRLASEWKPNG